MESEQADQRSERRPWTEPKVQELDMSRTANNPANGFDGGVGDCQQS
jgi:hypothetical protein